MASGECWIFDTWRLHRVHNDAKQARIHLVVDTVGGEDFWKLVSRGRPNNAPVAGWSVRQVMPTAGQVVEFPCESINVPVVMTPWELRHLMGLLFSDTVPHPHLPQVQTIAAMFTRTWHGLWSTYGDKAEGHPYFREALRSFLAEIEAPARPLMLKNTLPWFGALDWMITQYALGADAPTQTYS